MNEQTLKQRIQNEVIRLETSVGHLKWKVSDLARMEGISRPLVYYHFGRTKLEILLKCFESIAHEFYGFSEERMELIRRRGILESLRETRRLYLENPSYAIFYQKWRTTPSILQDKYVEIEEAYIHKLRSLFPNRKDAELKTIHAVFHGLVTAPFADDMILLTAVHTLGLR